MGNNHERLTMIHLIKRISLLNQQSVCNSLHHFLTFSQLTVLSINIIVHDSTVNCENVRIWCGELHTDCWFNKDICLLRWIMVNSSLLLPVMKWIMVNSSWHPCSVRGTLFWRIANALKLCLGPRTSNLGPRTSNLGPRTSNLGPRTSGLDFVLCGNVRLPAVDFNRPVARQQLLLVSQPNWIMLLLLGEFSLE